MITEKQKQFIESFEGESRGRYHISYLAIIRIVGGNELRKDVQNKYGRDVYKPDEMYPTKEASQMIIYASEKGVSIDRMGRMVAKTYARENPDVFKDLDTEKAINLLLLAYSEETSFGSSLKLLERGPDRAVLERTNSVMPCEFFKGVILGMFELMEVPAEVKETKCQWKDESPGCVYEVTWN